MNNDSGAPTNGTSGSRDAVIKVENISRWFGNMVSVSDVSFEIKPGITGLLGPNARVRRRY